MGWINLMKNHQLINASMAAVLFNILFAFTNASPIEARTISSCAELAAYANKIKWNPPVRFIGFQGGFSGMTKSCNGYTELKSPMGTKVCEAILTYGPGLFQNGVAWETRWIVNLGGGNAGWHEAECRYR